MDYHWINSARQKKIRFWYATVLIPEEALLVACCWHCHGYWYHFFWMIFCAWTPPSMGASCWQHFLYDPPLLSGSFPHALGSTPWSRGIWQAASLCIDESCKAEGPWQNPASCTGQPEVHPGWSWLDAVSWSHQHALSRTPKCGAVSLAMEIREEP